MTRANHPRGAGEYAKKGKNTTTPKLLTNYVGN